MKMGLRLSLLILITWTFLMSSCHRGAKPDSAPTTISGALDGKRIVIKPDALSEPYKSGIAAVCMATKSSASRSRMANPKADTRISWSDGFQGATRRKFGEGRLEFWLGATARCWWLTTSAIASGAWFTMRERSSAPRLMLFVRRFPVV